MCVSVSAGELLGTCFDRDNRIARLKSGQAEQGEAQFKAGLGQIQGGTGILGFTADRGHVSQN